jgi:ribosomal protein S18 acetylase RimI-like enzyme
VEIIKLSFSSLRKMQPRLLKFIRIYGDRRITETTRRWLNQVSAEDLETPGTEVLVALENRSLVGATGFSNYGLDHSFAVIHRNYRNQDIGKKMIETHLQGFGKIYGKVALDNTPSLKMCFGHGLIAFKLVTGPTGKPTLWFGGGNWNYSDVES